MTKINNIMVTAYIMDIPQSSHDTASMIDLVRKLHTKSATFVSHAKFVILVLIVLPIIFVIGFTLLCVLLIGKYIVLNGEIVSSF